MIKHIEPSIEFYAVGNYGQQFIYPMSMTLDQIEHLNRHVLIQRSDDSRWTDRSFDGGPFYSIANLEALTTVVLEAAFKTPPIPAKLIQGGWESARHAFVATIPLRLSAHRVSYLIVSGYTDSEDVTESSRLYPNRIMQLSGELMRNSDETRYVVHVVTDDHIMSRNINDSLLKTTRPSDILLNKSPAPLLDAFNDDFGPGVVVVDMRSTLPSRGVPVLSNATNIVPMEYVNRIMAAWGCACEEHRKIGGYDSERVISARKQVGERTFYSHAPLAEISRETSFTLEGYLTLGDFKCVVGKSGPVLQTVFPPKPQSQLKPLDPLSPEGIVAIKIIDIVNGLTVHSGVLEVNLVVNEEGEVIILDGITTLSDAIPDENWQGELRKQIQHVVVTGRAVLEIGFFHMTLSFKLFTEAEATVFVNGTEMYSLRRPLFATGILSSSIR